MSKPLVIIKAWINVFKGLTTEEHKRKAIICEKCPNREYNKYLDFVDDELKNVKGFICGICKCPLIAKIRSTDKCDLNKW